MAVAPEMAGCRCAADGDTHGAPYKQGGPANEVEDSRAIRHAALFLVPSVVVRLLLGTGLGPEPAAVARVLGVTLVSLAAACWPGPAREATTPPGSLRGMLAYNAMAGAYFLYVWVRGEAVGVLLIPAWAFHVAMALALGGTSARA
jgi:hypothetical protein